MPTLEEYDPGNQLDQSEYYYIFNPPMLSPSEEGWWIPNPNAWTEVVPPVNDVSVAGKYPLTGTSDEVAKLQTKWGQTITLQHLRGRHNSNGRLTSNSIPGYYWSGTGSDAGGEGLFGFSNNYLMWRTDIEREWGYPVRCVK
jgi:hypothetical protein